MRVTDTQGTKIYLAPQGTDVSTISAVTTAIATAKIVGCLQTIGDISATRSTQDYSCMSSDDVVTSLGSVTYAETSIVVLFDADDAAGKKDMEDAFDTKTRRVLIIEFNDKPDEEIGSTPTFIVFEAAFTAKAIQLPKDGAVQVSTTIKPATVTKFNRVSAA